MAVLKRYVIQARGPDGATESMSFAGPRAALRAIAYIQATDQKFDDEDEPLASSTAVEHARLRDIAARRRDNNIQDEEP